MPLMKKTSLSLIIIRYSATNLVCYAPGAEILLGGGRIFFDSSPEAAPLKYFYPPKMESAPDEKILATPLSI